MQPAKAKQPAVEALRLLGMWQRLATGHVLAGGGCSCGVAAAIPVQDLEQDILDFLQRRHGRRAASLAVLLSGIARDRSAGSAEAALLRDLERSLDSFDEVHRGRGS